MKPFIILPVLSVLSLCSLVRGDVIADWTTTPLPQNTSVWNIGQTTSGFGDWCMYSHGRWDAGLWTSAWQPTGPVILPTKPGNNPDAFRSACNAVPVPAGCSLGRSAGGGSNGTGSCVTSSDNVCANAGDAFSISARIRLDPAISEGMTGFTPAVWTFHDGHWQVPDPRDPAGTGGSQPGDGSEIDIEPGTLARYNRNGMLLVPATSADVSMGTFAASASDPDCGAQGDYLLWPGQDDNDGCTGFALCRGFSQRNCKFTVGDATLVSEYHYTDLVTVAMDLYDGGTPGSVDLADGAIHEYRFDSDINANGKGCATFFIDDVRIMGICDDHLVFYNHAIGAPDDIVCVRAYPGGTLASFYWDATTGQSIAITPAEFDFGTAPPPGTGLTAGLNSAPAQLFIGPWMPTWTGTPCPQQQLNHEIYGAEWGATHDADFNGDQAVNGGDLGHLLANFGQGVAGGYHSADLNRNGIVDGADIGLLVAGWSPSYP
jgi:hypothetical protein